MRVSQPALLARRSGLLSRLGCVFLRAKGGPFITTLFASLFQSSPPKTRNDGLVGVRDDPDYNVWAGHDGSRAVRDIGEMTTCVGAGLQPALEAHPQPALT